MSFHSLSLNYYAITGWINAAVSFACGSLVYFHSPTNKKNLAYSVHCWSVALWSFFYAIWMMCTNEGPALFFCRATMMFAIMLPSTHLQMILEIFDQWTPFRRKLLIASYVSSVILLLSNLTPYFIRNVVPKMDILYWPNPGPFFHIHLISFLIPLGFSLYLIWRFRTTASPWVRNQLAWLLFSAIFGYGGGGTNWPLWYDIPIPPVLNITVFVYIGISSFLFFRLGFFDIHTFFKETTTRALTSLLIGGLFSLAAYPLVKSAPAVVGFMVLVFLIPLIYGPVYSWVKKSLRRTGLGQEGAYLEQVDATMEKIKETTYTYDDLARNIVRSLRSTFPIEMAAVYFYDLSAKEFRLRAQEGMQNPLAKDLRYNRSSLALPESDPLIDYFAGRKEVVLRDALATELQADRRTKEAFNTLTRLEAEVCAPFVIAGKIKGFFVLARKKKNQMFNRDDLDAAYTFARMGEEVMRYIMGMEAELQNTALYSHDMANDTRSLIQTLDFLHSPMAKNLPPERAQLLFTQAEEVAVRINNVIQTNRERSALIMKSIRGDYDRSPMDITQTLRGCCDKFALTAEKKNVRLNCEISVHPSIIEGNADDILRVVDNLLGNAFRYVNEGGRIDLKGHEEKNDYVIRVSDDGRGILPEDLPKIWEMGWQVKGDSKKGAAGFGLSIVKQIVTLHQGVISVESEGLGKGTTFIIRLPLLTSGVQADGKMALQKETTPPNGSSAIS